MLKLNEIEYVPDALLSLSDLMQIKHVFTQPTLMYLTVKETRPLFISVLMHGNEDTGFYAVQKLLKKYRDRDFPRSLIIFFGNVLAAEKGVRRLIQQPDYNRVWPGTEAQDSPEKRLMQEVVDRVKARDLFASIDLHNNTGINPHYGCINSLEDDFVHLAQMFSKTVVFFKTPKGVQSMAFAPLCPAITIECGKPHLPHGVEHAMDFVETVLHTDKFPSAAVNYQDVDIFHTVARVTVDEKYSFSFSDTDADICLDSAIERMNFCEIHEGAVFGQCQAVTGTGLIAWNEEGKDVSERYFTVSERNIIQLKRDAMPAMLTLDERVIRQDCLCYLMEKLEKGSVTPGVN